MACMACAWASRLLDCPPVLQRRLWHRCGAQHHSWLRLGGLGHAGGAHSSLLPVFVAAYQSAACEVNALSDSRWPPPLQIALWFRADELANYTPVATAWIYE